MDDDILNDLAAKIANRDCVLFAGAGLSMQGGGPSWGELLSKTAGQFDYDSPMIDILEADEESSKFDYFDIFSDIVQQNNTDEVHDYVAKQLDDISLEEPVAELAGLPWYATFTTNYDTSLEHELRSRQNRTVQKVLTESDYPMSGLPSNLLHVQLMGSVERGPTDEGSMVLTGDEKRTALDSRSAIFQRLEAHAANLSFLFLGYSFQDDIFTDVLRGITASLGTPENTFYALFRSPLTESDRAFLESQNIEPIIANLPDFSEKLVEKVRARDTDDARIKSVPAGNELLKVDQNEAGDFLSGNNPILNERFSKEVSVKDFFKGDSSSFRPFSKEWHYRREEEEKIVRNISDGGADVIPVSGPPGSGRSYLINAAVERLITEHGGIAFEIFNTDLSPIPDSSNLNQFIRLLETEARRLDADLPSFAVFFSEGEIVRSELLQFLMLREKADIPLYCIFETYEDYTPPEINDLSLHEITVDNQIPGNEQEEFIDYLVEITRQNKLQSISRKQVNNFLNDNPEFFPVMYRAIYPTQQSIQKIVDEEYNDIDDDNAKKIVELCALSSSVSVDIPISVCRRYINESSTNNLSYKDVFDLAKDEAHSLVTLREDTQSVQHLSIYHPIIANYLSKEFGRPKMDEILEGLGRSVRLKSRHEAAFINELLISNGVNIKNEADAPFSRDGLQHALEILKEQQPSRPIIHHLGRLMSKRGASPDEFLPVLKEALNKPDKTYALEEDKVNILTTIAHELWEHKEARLATEQVSHPEIQQIFDYIERARSLEDNLYSYGVQSDILLDMAQAQEGEGAVQIVNRAINLIERGLEQEGDYETKSRLRRRKVELWKEIDEETAEEIARELLHQHDRGDGFYTLAALYFYEKQRPNEALNKLDRAMEAEDYPPQTPYLRLQILLEEQYSDYEKMLELVQELESRTDFHENWKSAFIKAVVHFINGNGNKAEEYFTKAWQSAPRSERYGAKYFWNERGSHKIFDGKIGSDLTSSEGHLYGHGIEGWDEDIYFNPKEQDAINKIQPGMKVNFELGFSPRGPIGWDLTLVGN